MKRISEAGYSVPIMMYQKDVDTLDELIKKTGLLAAPVVDEAKSGGCGRKALITARKVALSQLIALADYFVQERFREEKIEDE